MANIKKTIFALIPIFVFSCSSNLWYIKNISYFNNEENLKKLFVCPISSIEFDDTTRDYSEAVLKINTIIVGDSLLRHFNSIYLALSKKYIKNNVTLIDTNLLFDYSFDDTSQYICKKIYDKNKKHVFRLKYLKKNMLDSLDIKCDYALFISDIKVHQTKYYVPIFIPLPGGAISGNATGPALGLNGKYVLWDFTKDSIICAGNFRKNFMTTKIGDNQDSIRLHSVIAGILNKTPYWKVRKY